jgi:hypothetical protein
MKWDKILVIFTMKWDKILAIRTMKYNWKVITIQYWLKLIKTSDIVFRGLHCTDLGLNSPKTIKQASKPLPETENVIISTRVGGLWTLDRRIGEFWLLKRFSFIKTLPIQQQYESWKHVLLMEQNYRNAWAVRY